MPEEQIFTAFDAEWFEDTKDILNRAKSGAQCLLVDLRQKRVLDCYFSEYSLSSAERDDDFSE